MHSRTNSAGNFVCRDFPIDFIITGLEGREGGAQHVGGGSRKGPPLPGHHCPRPTHQYTSATLQTAYISEVQQCSLSKPAHNSTTGQRPALIYNHLPPLPGAGGFTQKYICKQNKNNQQWCSAASTKIGDSPNVTRKAKLSLLGFRVLYPIPPTVSEV